MMHRPNAERTGTRLLLTALVLMGAVSLSACSDADWDLLASLAEDWASSNNLWDGENINMGNLARLGVEEQIDEILNGPPPALVAGSIAEEIREADGWANAGAQRGGEEGLQNIEKAIAMRPDDWSYWEQKGALLLAEGRNEEAQAAFDHSASLARGHVVEGGGDCKLYARNLLTQREQALVTQAENMRQRGQEPPEDVVRRIDNVRAELALLDTSAGQCG